MGKTVTVRGRLADPLHLVLDEAVKDLSGPLEVVLRPVPNPVRGSDRAALARMLQATAAVQKTDSVVLMREDRDR